MGISEEMTVITIYNRGCDYKVHEVCAQTARQTDVTDLYRLHDLNVCDEPGGRPLVGVYIGRPMTDDELKVFEASQEAGDGG